MESYLSAVKQFKFRKAMSKLRLSNHCLRIERGRYQNESLANRICIRCTRNSIEDEHHFLIQCPAYEELRRDLISSLALESLNMNYVFSPEVDVAVPICKYVYRLFERRNSTE